VEIQYLIFKILDFYVKIAKDIIDKNEQNLIILIKI